jgi:hypothetical protein
VKTHLFARVWPARHLQPKCARRRTLAPQDARPSRRLIGTAHRRTPGEAHSRENLRAITGDLCVERHERICADIARSRCSSGDIGIAVLCGLLVAGLGDEVARGDGGVLHWPASGSNTVSAPVSGSGMYSGPRRSRALDGTENAVSFMSSGSKTRSRRNASKWNQNA